jgi:hypothetical protein
MVEPTPASLTWILPGGGTYAGSTWSTPTGSPSKPSAEPVNIHVVKSKADRWIWLLLAGDV